MMLRMILGSRRAVGAALALGALAVTGAPTRAVAQDVRSRTRVERDDCRCVDRDGKPIENCTCFVMPDVDRIVTGALARVVVRPRLGITLGNDTDARGAPVTSVMEDGPAEEAGIREGDIITRLDGRSLLEPLGSDMERRLDEDGSLPTQRLMALVRDIEPGQEVEVEFLRDGERRTVTVEARELEGGWSFTFNSPEGLSELRTRLRALPEAPEMRFYRAPDAPEQIRFWADSLRTPRIVMGDAPGMQGFMFRSGGDGILRACPTSSRGSGTVHVFSTGCLGGVQAVELNPGLAEYFGTSRGVLVADVHEDSALGVLPGDVILAVGDRETDDPDGLRRILGSYTAEETVTLRIVRQKREMSVQGTLGG